MKITTKITRKHLETLSKDNLIRIVREMEVYLLSMHGANEEMSWHGQPSNQQMCMTRGYAFKDAATELQKLAAPH